MNTDSLKNSIDTLRSAVEANTVTPDIVAAILESIRQTMQTNADSNDSAFENYRKQITDALSLAASAVSSSSLAKSSADNALSLANKAYALASSFEGIIGSPDDVQNLIDSWRSIEDFLQGVTDSDSLSSLLLEQESRLTRSSAQILTTQPVPSKDYADKVFIYVGPQDPGGTFYTGNKYVCRQYDGGYRWEPLYGYVIADAIRTAGSGLPTGTVVLPLAANSVNDVVYHGGTPYVFTTSGWQVWKADTGKVTVTYTLPAASAEYLDMTFVSTNPLDGNYPPGLYQCVKSGDGYGWDKKALLCEENFTAEEKEKLAGIDSLLAEQKTSLEAKIADEASRATAAEQTNAEAISTETVRATAAEQFISASLTEETSRATTAEEVLHSSINTISAAMPSISDMDIAEIDSLGNMATSGTYIISDGAERGFMLFENTGNNAQRQTLYMGNTLKYRTRDAGGWGEWSVLADFGNGLAAVATSGSYNDLKNRPSLSSVATSGNYESLSNKPLQGSISFDAADSLCQSYQNGVYIVTDGGLTQGLLSFATAGNGGLMQYLLQDGTIKSRSGSYTGGSPSWGDWIILNTTATPNESLANVGDIVLLDNTTLSLSEYQGSGRTDAKGVVIDPVKKMFIYFGGDEAFKLKVYHGINDLFQSCSAYMDGLTSYSGNRDFVSYKSIVSWWKSHKASLTIPPFTFIKDKAYIPNAEELYFIWDDIINSLIELYEEGVSSYFNSCNATLGFFTTNVRYGSCSVYTQLYSGTCTAYTPSLSRFVFGRASAPDNLLVPIIDFYG